MRTGLSAKLKSIFLGAVFTALFSFGFQSVALPIHASIHAAQQTFASESTHANIVESDCELCDFAAHQAIQISSVLVLDSVETIELHSEPGRPGSPFLSLSLLPPVRGPPELA